jgi:P-aminobenzoate N-oxygenase AurF
VFPDLSDDLLLNLFHKGAKAQWTSRDLDWSAETTLSPRQRLALARLLTPVYFGEQTAMAGASGILPKVMAAGEATAQLYLASFIMDEARHFETLTRLYRSLGHDPLGLREIPELLRYHHRIRQGDRADWVWGILFSDVIAKHFYRAFGASQTPGDPLFGSLSNRILQDESRHLAFAEHYLRRNVAGMEPARRRALIEMRDDLFRILQAMTERVRADAAAFDIDSDDYLGWVWSDVEAFGKRIGLLDRPQPPPPPPDRRAPSALPYGRADAGTGSEEEVTQDRAHDSTLWDPLVARGRVDESTLEDHSVAHGRATDDRSSGPWASTGRTEGVGSTPVEPEAAAEGVVARCFGCLLTMMCGRRVATA